MEQRPEQHLTYDDLLRTLVDKSDLGAGLLAHFDSCPQCQHQAQRLEQRYEHMGHMARKLAPSPMQAFRLPEENAPITRRWQFKPALAMGLVGALILVFTVWWPTRFKPTEPKYMTAQNMEEERRLMQEIDALVEDALPKAYQQMASISEPNFSQDLIDLIVPSIEEDDKQFQPRAQHPVQSLTEEGVA